MRGHVFASIVIGMLVASSTGCGSKGPMFQAVPAPADRAVIYVYRPDTSAAGAGVELQMKVDGKPFGKLKNNGYLYTTVAPGKRMVTCRTESTSQVPIDAAAGRSYYVKASVAMGFFVGRPQLEQVPEETGKLAIAGTRSSMAVAKAN